MTYLSLGGNIPPRMASLRRALAALASEGTVGRTSAPVESEPWGYEDRNWYVNLVCAYETALSPMDLLDFTQEVERSGGRPPDTKGRYTSRPIDIDILFYDDRILDERRLTIPHPRLHLRNFVLVPLAEIAPDLVHPVRRQTVRELLKNSKDTTMIRAYTS